MYVEEGLGEVEMVEVVVFWEVIGKYAKLVFKLGEEVLFLSLENSNLAMRMGLEFSVGGIIREGWN